MTPMNPKPDTFLFRTLLAAVRSQTPGIEWRAYYRGSDGINELTKLPEMMTLLEELFRQELSSSYSAGQRHLIEAADVAVVALESATGRVLCYTTGSYLPPGAVEGCSYPVLFGGHCVVASDYHGKRLGTFASVCVCVFGRSPLRLFEKILMVGRTGNPAFYRYFSSFGRCYRSDEMATAAPTREVESARTIMRFVHDEYFLLSDFPLPEDRPLPISHRFSGETIPGVKPNEILYLCSVSTLAKFLRTIAAGLRRSRRRMQSPAARVQPNLSSGSVAA